ncbi:MAG: RelA/SpoT family protein [Treponema sp.]|nr:RelA/SpoT family protein [Treponema sp.]
MSKDSLLQEQNTDPNTLLQRFFADFPSYTDQEKNKFEQAWNYFCTKSAHLKRACGEPYYVHPMRVAYMMAKNHLDIDGVIAGLFHSITEIEGVTEEEVEKLFGKDVASIIHGTAKITNLKINNNTLQQADSIRKMLFAMVDDVRVILVKMADRLDRMRYLKSVTPEEQKAVAQEVIDIWAPLADRLGMSAEKNEMEDLSLKYNNPAVFQQIKAIVAQKKDERAQYLEKAVQAIQKAAVKLGMNVSITSRAKHFYSIYQKMRKRNKEAGDLYDLLALRIICNTVPECYTLVGIVHNLWKPLDGRFKDYIAMPKANGYQSLHTTVMCEGKPLEIQIRTVDMHTVAEHGVASHWLYKKGSSHDLVDVEHLSIFNQLRELRTSHLNDEAFFNELKNDLLGDEIYVFTPKGDVVQLPAGSTAIDFAYHVHSAIGEKIVGAKADGKIIPLSTPLKNTQIIDIITNPQAHPTANQLPMVHTSKARSKIRAWLNLNDPTFVDKERAAKIAAENVANAVYSQKKQRVRHHPEGFDADVQKKGTGKIRIGNTTNFLVTMAKCCNPKHGDPIVGYVSRGRGITIHKADCLTYQRIRNVESRTLEVEWDEEETAAQPQKKK